MHTHSKINIKELNTRILSDKYNSIIFTSKGNLDIYIVGGYLRDILLGREGLDRDYAVSCTDSITRGDFTKFLEKVASKIDGKIVRIGRRNLQRIVTENGVTLDFMPVDKNIEHDVSVRDFTINSLAWSPERGIIDLHDGINDLSDRIIRMIKIENLKDDPVRIIRAYRFADELSFEIETETREALKILSGLIKEAKTERVTLEFFRIISLNSPAQTLKKLLRDGVLGQIISIPYHKLEAKLKVIDKINEIINKLPLNYRMKLNQRFSQNLTYKGLLRLGVLLQGMPENTLNMSLVIYKRLIRLDKADKFSINTHKSIKKGELYEIFRITEEASIDYLIIKNLSRYLGEMERYYSIKKRGILSTNEIIKVTRIDRGKALGDAIEILRKAQFENLIKTKQEARELLK